MLIKVKRKASKSKTQAAMASKTNNIITIATLTVAFLFFQLLFSMQTYSSSNFQADSICPAFTKDIDNQCLKVGQNQCQLILKKCEEYYQKKSSQYQTQISAIKKKERNLNYEIKLINNKVKSLNYQIYKNNLIIKDLSIQIKDTEKSIGETEKKIDEIKNKLGTILELRREEDKRSFIELFLSDNNLSDFFDDIIALEALNRKTQDLLSQIKKLEESLVSQQKIMLSNKTDLEKRQILADLQKRKNEEAKKEKNKLLMITKGKKSLYQKYLKEAESEAEKIRKKIFELAQVSEKQSLTMEEAYRLAVSVGKITGIRPALLLGLLKVESNIGNNVGQCNCDGRAYCRYPNIHWQSVMRKSQWPYFQRITAELGMKINSTPVSCSVRKGIVQWGGAMGPAQMMPETWYRYGYKKRVEEITGVKPANPWRVKDAFLAAALYLSDWGANSRREIDEIGAVRAYLCGTTKLTRACRIAGGRGYVYNVMKYADKFQNYINKGILK